MRIHSNRRAFLDSNGNIEIKENADINNFENIRENKKLGLNFIKNIKTYYFKKIGGDRYYNGIIGQDIEKILKDMDLDIDKCSFIKRNNYSISYTEFIPIIIKSIQELDKQKSKRNIIDIVLILLLVVNIIF